ncbi:3-deoxy-manno-octulosonate cytidylyltransferase [Nonlabens spongiae]|uniref:3-deoxy-manno-octulosonate cytidylyltransferase n=1 Tax=Nonlabens spongiae TaxID=331648 RepID=A0A1W6MG07_9FLAO|nr:3-deoxy-manno-octulosonate cytidylyltransferase [Nonlabens spongiae]ARN76541.1 3-deoxy-manno-octulosonate cytidylyltransferase [Nonlabens spongiae]
MQDFVIVIPARYESTRLPGKPLLDIHGKSLLRRTYEQCIKAVDDRIVYVATDDKRIIKHCEKYDIQAVLTSSNCLTGTDRVAEFAIKVPAKTYINVQGDEPLMNPKDILNTIKAIKEHPYDIINGYASIDSEEDYRSSSIPKVVSRPDGRLLYMSRSPIPGNKKHDFIKSWRQICVYGFPAEALKQFAALKHKTPLENEEDIEILRFLELGYEVRMIELSANSVAVDTPADLLKVQDIISKKECYD